MTNRLPPRFAAVALAFAASCAGPRPVPEQPAAPPSAIQPAIGASDPVGATVATVAETVTEKPRQEREKRAVEKKTAAASLTVECSVKLPDDPTDNPGLCRSFQIVFVDEEGNESPRYRFGGDARYRFAAKPGKKYRVKPIIGKNWEFTVDPDRELVAGEKAHVQLRQKE